MPEARWAIRYSCALRRRHTRRPCTVGFQHWMSRTRDPEHVSEDECDELGSVVAAFVRSILSYSVGRAFRGRAETWMSPCDTPGLAYSLPL